jgi:HD-GYP domain-containing protein (c-di-GMP phosphodiesterase class II)
MIDVAPEPAPAQEADDVRTMDRVEAALRRDARLSHEPVTRPHRLLAAMWRPMVLSEGGPQARVCVVFAPAAVWERGRDVLSVFTDRFADGSALLVIIGQPSEESLQPSANPWLASVVGDVASDESLYVATRGALDLLEAKARAEVSGQSLRRYRYELGELIHIARAMTTVRDVDKLLGLILEKSRFVTGADAGSIYIVEARDGDEAVLRFKLTQNDSVAFDSREFTMPLSERSIAGSSALRKTALNIPDVYAILAPSTFHFDPSFDRRTGYITRSTLAIPLISQRDEVIGVIQLINKKRDPSRRLLSKTDVDEQVIAFDERSEELLGMLAAQAGVSLETAMLYEEIRNLFNGFVTASVEAIESRDPTTSGHSRRVANLTTELAKIVDRETTGPYASASFTKEDLRELEYASVLHDFGKIGVREKVLVKARKLYDERLELVRARFDYVARSIEAEVLTRKVRLLERGTDRGQLDALDSELALRLAELDAAWEAICGANQPTVLATGDCARIDQISRETFVDLRGQVRTLLDDEERTCLSVSRGSLTPQEFEEIRSHVSHTFRFLSRIPWGKSLRRVPLIAAAHHERLDGKGYPNRLHADEIPLQSKIMSVADIYDALTASDRPYKKAVPLEQALGILDQNVTDGHLDRELVRMFKQAQVWLRAGALEATTTAVR